MKRLTYIDNIRILLISLVVLHHLAVSYAAQGTWYHTHGSATGITPLIFSGFLAFNQSFFMGFLFLISAYFTPASYDKKGFFTFIKERIFRLGIPLLFYVIVIHPFLNYIVNDGFTVVSLDYFKPFIERYDVLGLGPMWFIALLLILDLLYAVFRVSQAKIRKVRLPGDFAILIFALVLASANFVIRIWVPMDRIFKPINLHFPFITQYTGLFIAGLFAYRGEWFSRAKAGYWKISTGILAGFIPIGLMLTNNQEIYFGGFTVYSLLFSLWEQLFGISIILTLLVWFRDNVNRSNRFWAALSASSYATYVFHQFALIPATLLLAVLEVNALLKFLIAAPIALLLSFSMGWIFRKLPGFRKVFG
jgi:peptidoglycan/LPS O-acetylase OafA/YrhL